MRRAVAFVVLFIFLQSTSARADAPQPISPGSARGSKVVQGRCPTFHWTARESAVELVVYRISAEGPLETAEPVIRLSLPGATSGWTPSLDRCLEYGGRYAWSLRADGGEWSEASLFTVATVESPGRVAGEAPSERNEAPAAAGARPDRPVPVARVTGESAPASPGQEQLGGPLRSDSVAARGGAPAPAVPTPGAFDLSIAGDFSLGGFVFKEGFPFLHNDGGEDKGNTSLGLGALVSLTHARGGSPESEANTAVGQAALRRTTSGYYNTAVGYEAMFYNTTGFSNTAVGRWALREGVYGRGNVAIGASALKVNTGNFNTAVGRQALLRNTTGIRSTAIGGFALLDNNEGRSNTAVGYAALLGNTTGDGNTAVGDGALQSNTTGIANTATGYRALFKATTVDVQEGINNTANGLKALYDNTTGSANTALGVRAAYDNTTGAYNTGVGAYALFNNMTGNSNIALGYKAGFSTIGSNNILIGNYGASESNVIRIGTAQTGAFLAGVYGSAVGTSGLPVLVDLNGKLGTMTVSSRRFKEDIRGMDEASRPLLDLRPVTFRMKGNATEASRDLQFGLIAEEVADVLPELAIYDDDGRPLSVRYHLLPPLLLNEVQRQHRRIQLQGWLMGIMALAGLVLASRGRFG